MITLSEKNSYIAEQFRTIRANIKFIQEEQKFKTAVITSSIPGEGKSTNAANIAVVFAQEGKKVLLIDADLRKPTMHYTFRLQNEFGLSNILSGLSKSNFGIQETLIDGLDILTSGPIPHNPAELLASTYLDILLEEVRSNYHIIIFDTPPILAASDAQILANKCDGTILIANIGYVKKWELEKTNASIHASKANLLGIILNNYKLAKSSYYYYE
ncbi:CpsD/CapB family tyrosine-protein kinase [Ureibacillus manganicus]|uniref:CpsD/CapB family tyrosine-protein kinase n=1 Tax=Ureibacillus manganicus TaxID=1266064 RepID=UPI001F260E2B|nr:CpsD/CapB family tyrosine-protein kinase [Ureibacillus manganicus]